jgi:hypothetical protein
MPLITPMSPASLTDIISAQAIYEDSVYLPGLVSNIPTQKLTFEILNGGLDKENYTEDKYRIDPSKVQAGSFAQGYYYGFDRNDFMCAEQTFSETSLYQGTTAVKNRVVHSSLAADVFLPFQPTLVLFGFQALFCQDATYWKTSVSELQDVEDFWDVALRAGNLHDVTDSSAAAVQPAYYQRLPNTRWVNGLGGGAGSSKTDAKFPLSDEDSYRFVSRQGQISGASVKPGYFTCRVTIGALSHNNDIKKQELLTPSGGIWVLALR